MENALPPGWSEEMVRNEARRAEIMEELRQQNPLLPVLTAIIMAGDMAGAERWLAEVNEGKIEVTKAANLVGSYARFGFAVEHCPMEWVFANIGDLWRGSDPDDTDPLFLKVWRAAKNWNDGFPITDGDKLPDKQRLVVFRGQMAGDPFGISWSLSKDVALRFARGAGTRTQILGSVYQAAVPRSEVLAYLTGRGEAEIIADPKFLFPEPFVVAKWEVKK